MPFVCGATNLGEALRRIGEGASMIRTKGEAGTGDVVQAVTHARQILNDIKKIQRLDDEELMTEAKNLKAPYELVCEIKNTGKLPVVNFAAGGVATPADAALLMQIGVEGIFVGSGIFNSENPEKTADAIVQATTHFEDADLLAEVSKGLGAAMRGEEVSKINPEERLEKRGW
jgi:pyridoxal 5'-phosphate synthase pdxS subunit